MESLEQGKRILPLPVCLLVLSALPQQLLAVAAEAPGPALGAQRPRVSLVIPCWGHSASGEPLLHTGLSLNPDSSDHVASNQPASALCP